MSVPENPRIYHIVHFDRLLSIIEQGFLWSDARVIERNLAGTRIGMSAIKERRLKTSLNSHPELKVGQCVPFYFCPRSIMLYMLHKGNDADLSYQGGQDPIIHLEADLKQTVAWAEAEGLRWAFTLSNAGSLYFEDRSNLDKLDDLDWTAIQTRDWRKHKEGKQAEFLVEERFPWHLISCIGVHRQPMYNHVHELLRDIPHKPVVRVKPNWYY